MSLARAARGMSSARDELEATARAALHSVFISYARPDRALVEQLSDVLIAHGYLAWWDDAIRPGEDFNDHIIAALQAATAVVVLWSAHSVKSKWVRWEANQGLRQGKLVPVAVDDLDLRDIRPPFSDLNTLGHGDEVRLLGALRKLGQRT